LGRIADTHHPTSLAVKIITGLSRQVAANDRIPLKLEAVAGRKNRHGVKKRVVFTSQNNPAVSSRLMIPASPAKSRNAF
jgi:hypothetical protein